MTEHHLKTWPEPYKLTEQGLKTWEFRSTTDRNFEVGDVLVLEWWDPSPIEMSHLHAGSPRGYEMVVTDERYPGITHNKHLRRRVTYIMHGGRFGIPVGSCIMSIEKEGE